MQKRAGALVFVYQHVRRAAARGATARVFGVGNAAQVGFRHAFGEADHAVVRRVHLQQHGRVGRDGALVIEGVRLVRGAHLHHACVRLRHDVGTRKLPPISTSSPRLTMASCPAANSASTIMTAAALLFTAMAASAPVSVQMRCSTWS